MRLRFWRVDACVHWAVMEEPRSPRALVNGRMRPRFRVPAAKAASLKDVLELALSWEGAN